MTDYSNLPYKTIRLSKEAFEKIEKEEQMSEVDKLYELAGFKKNWTAIGDDDIDDCYPPFTAEKQLELIKLLCTQRYIDIRFTPEGEYYLFAYYIGCGFNKNFDEALAMFVIQYWQDLTESEQEQIREILK